MLWYLAHPYSGNEEENLKLSIKRTNILLNHKIMVFNPLTHSHALQLDKARKSEFWYDFDLKILKKCVGIIFAPKWEQSLGCRLEMKEAMRLGMTPLFYESVLISLDER